MNGQINDDKIFKKHDERVEREKSKNANRMTKKK